MPELSVIVPIYNMAQYLRSCLSGIKAQDFNDYEIICVNDGSTDHCSEILAELANTDERIKIVDQPNLCLLRARKNGVLASTGKYVIFLDPDDEIAPDMFNQLVSMMNRGKYDMISFSAELIMPEHPANEDIDQYKALHEFLNIAPGEFYGRDEILQAFFREGNVKSYNLCTKILRGDICRKAFADAEDIRLLTGEDGYAFLLLASYSNSALIIDSPFYRYFFTRGSSGNGISAQKFLRIMEDYRNLHEVLTRLKQNKPEIAVYADRLDHFLAKNITQVLPALGMLSAADMSICAAAYTNCFPEEAGREFAALFHREKLAYHAEHEQVKQLYTELEILQEHLKEHRNSLSWKITGPLRYLSKLLHRGE